MSNQIRKGNYPFGQVQSKKTAFTYTERNRLMEIGKELRSARPVVRTRLMQEAEGIVGDKELTFQDVRLISTYAQHGAARDDEQGAGREHWQAITSLSKQAETQAHATQSASVSSTDPE